MAVRRGWWHVGRLASWSGWREDPDGSGASILGSVAGIAFGAGGGQLGGAPGSLPPYGIPRSTAPGGSVPLDQSKPATGSATHIYGPR